MENHSGMLAFCVADGPRLAGIMAERLRIFHYAVSLGHQRSLIVYVATAEVQTGSFRLDAEHLARYRSYAGDGLFRVSIGLEDPADLCADLADCLDRL
jgi:methionine-gamma-lyase